MGNIFNSTLPRRRSGESSKGFYSFYDDAKFCFSTSNPDTWGFGMPCAVESVIDVAANS